MKLETLQSLVGSKQLIKLQLFFQRFINEKTSKHKIHFHTKIFLFPIYAHAITASGKPDF